jgi:hypothetical protein
MSEKKKWIHFGNVLVSKDKKDDNGNKIKGKPYIEIISDIELQKGDRLQMFPKLAQLKKQLEAGFINEERFEELKDKLSFIKYELLLPPREE